MDKKTYGIGVLALMAVVLLVANLLPIAPVRADEAIKDRDFILVTSRISQGGEGLYIVDNRTGQMAVFIWDPSARMIRLKDVKPVVDMFHD